MQGASRSGIPSRAPSSVLPHLGHPAGHVKPRGGVQGVGPHPKVADAGPAQQCVMPAGRTLNHAQPGCAGARHKRVCHAGKQGPVIATGCLGNRTGLGMPPVEGLPSKAGRSHPADAPKVAAHFWGPRIVVTACQHGGGLDRPALGSPWLARTWQACCHNPSPFASANPNGLCITGAFSPEAP